jgi:ATP-dependent protease HslVU (ClpYQ) peptidase subunit
MVTVIAAGDAGLSAAGSGGSYAALAGVFLIRRRTGRRA